MSGVAGRLREIRKRIAAAAGRAGRSPGEVALVAVTKTVDAGRVHEAVAAGQKLFGENRVQEAQRKIEALGPGVDWHLIGHLQRNKAKAAARLFAMVESIDSAALARELDRRASGRERLLPVLVQVSLAGEESKNGVSPEAAPRLIETVCALPCLELRGLMTIPPWPEKPEDSRRWFARLRELREVWDGACCPSGTLRELSMGMTADFEVAVEEGATIVRVGSALFGARPYP